MFVLVGINALSNSLTLPLPETSVYRTCFWKESYMIRNCSNRDWHPCYEQNLHAWEMLQFLIVLRMQWHIFACQRLALGQVQVHARLHNERSAREGVRSVISSVILTLKVTIHDTSSGYANCSQRLPLHASCTVIINR